MECEEAVTQTRAQVAGLPWGSFDRIVIPVGSGMSVAGVLWGLLDQGEGDLPVLGVMVGANPEPFLRRWAPVDYPSQLALVRSELDYHRPAPVQEYDGVLLDAVYEAKCLPHLRAGDLFWLVGIRQTATPNEEARA
jgi:hypothetical protein